MLLKKHFAEASISPGHRRLAELAEKGFFDVIFTTNGDVPSRSFAFTPSEISILGREGERILRHYLSRDMIIVGHGPRDYDINRAIEREGGSIWYAGQSPPPTDDLVYQAMRARGTQANVISGEFGLFDRFFDTLHGELMRYST